MTDDLSQCGNCIYHYTYNGRDMCKQVGDDFYLQWKVENCPYHTSITKVAAISDEIYRLKAENAALRERLEKTGELPCRVGDKVYCIHGMSNPELLEWQVNEIRITDHNYMLQLGRAGTKDYRNEASQFYGKWWFTELEAAEACLSELKGEKGCAKT